MKSIEHQFIELSHTVEDGMITYRGLPGPLISEYLSREESRSHYAEGTEFHIGKIEMVANTGTYIDSPFHRFASGSDLAALPLSSIANLDGVAIRISTQSTRAIGRNAFMDMNIRGKAVLVHTGWDVHWRTEGYFDGYPFLTADAAHWLAQAGAALVGIDSLNIDDNLDGTRPVHTTLLSANIPIIEHMCNLGSLPDQGFRFFAVPAKVKGLGSFPVRAFALTTTGGIR